MQTSRKYIAAIIFVTMLHVPSQGLAWNTCGHRVISIVAYEQLSDAQRTGVIEILKKHPRYEEDFVGHMPEQILAADEKTKGRWIFAHCSTWPDIASGFQGSDREQYHRPTWHYIDEPHFLSAEDRNALTGKLPVNLKREWSEDAEPLSLNVMQALKLIDHQLASDAVSDEDRAVYICWLFHLVGDVHQPCHVSSLYTRNRFKSGDRGGNSIFVGPDRKNLHALWDGMLGNSRTLNAVSQRAFDLLNDGALRKQAELANNTSDHETWLKESYRDIVQNVYHKNILSAVADNDDVDADLGVILLPDVYFEAAGDVARIRAIQAGYRLANKVGQLME